MLSLVQITAGFMFWRYMREIVLFWFIVIALLVIFVVDIVQKRKDLG
jgi:hypothetical protein